MSQLKGILPNEIVAVEQVGPPAGTLLEEEAEALGRAVFSRRMEFAAGRSCARRALEVLGVPAQPILRGICREPIWPAGIVGSITHCAGYCAAAVARDCRIESIGIDAEPNEPLPDGVLREIATETEIRFLEELPPGLACWDRLLFSAKESVYKAWYPTMKCWLGFEEAQITIYPADKTFQARIPRGDPGGGAGGGLCWKGRYAHNTEYVVTSLVIHR